MPSFNNSEYCNSGINLGLTGGKYLIKIIFDIKLGLRYSKYRMSQISITPEHFQFWDQYGPDRWQIFHKKYF